MATEEDFNNPENEINSDYRPGCWQAELYMRGLETLARGGRPDSHQQELLNLFDIIYNMVDNQFKSDIDNPNSLTYFLDYIEPIGKFADISIDTVGEKIYAYQKEKINRLYDKTVPDIVLVNIDDPINSVVTIKKCQDIGQAFAGVTSQVYNNLQVGTIGYTAKEIARNLLYQYTNYAETISITSLPIYYLDANHRISVYDRASGIKGDYIVNSISLPLVPGNPMSISASKAYVRL